MLIGLIMMDVVKVSDGLFYSLTLYKQVYLLKRVRGISTKICFFSTTSIAMFSAYLSILLIYYHTCNLLRKG